MYQKLFKNLSKNDLVLTVNQRLASILKSEYAIHQQQQQQTVWATPDILPISSWLQRTWETILAASLSEPLTLLAPHQQRIVWEKIIEASSTGHQLLCVNATAELAQQAWQLVQQWQLDFNTEAFTQSEDIFAWQTWAKEFVKRCQENHWLDHQTLPNHITKLVQKNVLPLPTQIYLLGFDEINPQYQQLFDCLSAQGCTVSAVTPTSITSQTVKLGLNDPATELQTMAEWAHQRWQKGFKNIGCVVPNLLAIRAQVVNVFTETFAPETHLPGYHATPLPFNISGGTQLKDYPLIHTAFSLLSLNELNDLNSFSLLLRSPYFGGAETEMLARANLDVVLQNKGEPWITIKQIIVAAKQQHCPLLAQYLEDYLASLTATQTVEWPHVWCLRFSQRLVALRWPGERSLDSTEYQLFERWNTLLEEFANLDAVLGKIDYQTAIQQLKQLASKTLFQPQSKTTTIQVLGLLETAGLTFDQLWVMGLDDNAWPPRANPNPFIPITLQRQHNMPHASAERELAFCRVTTDRLANSATQIILSYPQQQDDRLLRPSRLIHTIPPITVAELNLLPHQSYLENVHASGTLESLEHDTAPPVLSHETIHGGADIFKQQAACPFRAFARFRLGAKAIDAPQIGLNAKERGSLLHATLEVLWNSIRDHATLLSYSDQQLQTVIETAINTGLTRFIKNRPFTFKKRFTEIEKQRLQQILNTWLALEKNRPPFSIIAIEQNQEYVLANIPLKLRVDRIDQLEDGKHLILDYKTGDTSVKKWFGDRPDEPQLPLYCLASSTAMGGISFAEIKSNQFKFKGISTEALHIDGIIPIEKTNNESNIHDWENLVIYWRNILENLGEQFQQGYATVDPKKGAQTCEYCDLTTLCRIKEKI